MRYFILSALLVMSQAAKAETVQVKYLGPVPLDAFECVNINESSDVKRICYEKAERYMLIQLKHTFYQYCDIGPQTVANLRKAPSKRQFFEANIRGDGSNGPFDCRTHPIPSKYMR